MRFILLTFFLFCFIYLQYSVAFPTVQNAEHHEKGKIENNAFVYILSTVSCPLDKTRYSRSFTNNDTMEKFYKYLAEKYLSMIKGRSRG